MKKKPIISALILACFAATGCGQRADAQGSYNFAVQLDKKFVTSKSPYTWWPTPQEELFSSGGGGGGNINLNFNNCGDGRVLVAAVAIILALVIVVETTEVTYHQVSGIHVMLTIEGDTVFEQYPLEWGMNRCHLSDKALTLVESGNAKMLITSSGTRRMSVRVPGEGLKSRRDIHLIELCETGTIVTDGTEITIDGLK